MRHTKILDRENPVDEQLALLEDLLKRVAPDNIAPMPIAMTMEDGEWTVDISVRRRRITDYEVSGSDKNLATALANARRSLAHQQANERRATRDATRFAFSL